MPSGGWRTAAVTGVATVVAGSSAGTASWAAYKHLMSQASKARDVIPQRLDKPPEADGIYTPGCGQPQPWRMGAEFDIHLMIFGDSTAAGVGCTVADEVPGVLIARGVADESGKRIRLSTKAISGATSKGLAGQVDAMFVAGKPPDAAVILVGANDILRKHSIPRSAHRVGEAVQRLRDAGSVVVVGTCPDLGIVTAIPQPLRTVVRQWGFMLRRAQTASIIAAGGHPVALADLLSPEFLASPETMFDFDGFHPSAAGYELAAENLLPPLLEALGEWRGGPLPDVPEVSEAAERRRLVVRAADAANRFLWRHQAARVSS